MSKYLGKLLIESGASGSSGSSGFGSGTGAWAELKYCKSSDRFWIRTNGFGEAGCKTTSVSASLLYAMCEEPNILPFQYKWSVGYKVKEKKGVESINEMRLAEQEWLGSVLSSGSSGSSGSEAVSGAGRRSLFLDGHLNSDEDFDLICVLQYGRLTRKVLDQVVVQWKRKKWGRTGSRWVSLGV